MQLHSNHEKQSTLWQENMSLRIYKAAQGELFFLDAQNTFSSWVRLMRWVWLEPTQLSSSNL